MPSIPLPETYPWKLFSIYQQGGNTYTFAGFNIETNLWGMPGIKNTSSDPHWRDKVLAKVDASQPYSIRKLLDWKVKRMSLVCSTPPEFDLSTSDMTFAGHTSIPTGITDDVLRDQALAKMKRKLLNETKSFEVLVPLAEAKDLSRTVRSAVDLTTSAVRELLEIKRTKGKSAIKYASKVWLTYGFGVRPILSDIQSLNAAISAFLTREDRVIRISSSANKEWVSSLPQVTTTFNRLARAVYNTRVEHYLSYRYVAGFSLPLKSSNNYGAHQQFGTDLPSLVPALWEASVFSWVADYFGNVGEYLSDVFEAPSGHPRYITLNRLYIAKFKSVGVPNFEPNVLVHSRVDGEASGRYLEFDRTLIPGNVLPHRLLRFRTGDEIANHGVSKLLNLAALLGSSRK